MAKVYRFSSVDEVIDTLFNIWCSNSENHITYGNLLPDVRNIIVKETTKYDSPAFWAYVDRLLTPIPFIDKQSFSVINKTYPELFNQGYPQPLIEENMQVRGEALGLLAEVIEEAISYED